MMTLHLVADTVPRGTTFCQKVPEKVYKKKQQPVSHIVLWTTHWTLHYNTVQYCTATSTVQFCCYHYTSLHCSCFCTALK